MSKNMDYLSKIEDGLLDLHNEGLGDEDVKEMVRVLLQKIPPHTPLNIDLSFNCIGDVGAKILARFLEQDIIKVGILYLDMNNIRDVGAMALANTLKHNTTLTSLILGNNRFGNGSFGAFAETLKSNVALKRLNLCTPVCQNMDKFVNALESNLSLLYLDVWVGRTNRNIFLLKPYLERNRRYYASLQSMYKMSKVVYRSFKKIFPHYVQLSLLFDYEVFDEVQNTRLSNFFLNNVSNSITRVDALRALKNDFNQPSQSNE